MRVAPVAAMGLLAGTAIAVLLMTLAQDAKANPPPYCGHHYRQYTRDLGALGPTILRITHQWSSGVGSHIHGYRIVRYRAATNSWVKVKPLERYCPNRHPV